MLTCQVDSCNHPIPTGVNSTACPGCMNRLYQTLRDIADLETELNITITRQNVSGDTNTRTRTETPLPYHQAASDTLTDLLGTLTVWANLTAAPPADHPAVRLLRHTEIHRHPEAHLAVTEIRAASARAWHVIDRAPDRIYAGPCRADTGGERCPDELYAKPDAPTTRCPTCGTEWDVTERREWLLNRLRDTLVTATEAARAIATYGTGSLTQPTISKWKSRGLVTTRGHDGKGHDLYRMGDLLDLTTTRLDNMSTA